MNAEWQENLVNSVSKRICGSYELPTFPGRKVFYVVPMSGGLDSFCVAYTLLALYGDSVPFSFVHCDTGVEADGTEDALDLFEKNTGKKIIKIAHKDDMLTMIEKSGNFLPSQRQRSCTQMMKTLPIKRFFEQLKLIHGDEALFCQFVGIRADEPKRKGIEWTEDYIVSDYPLQKLGLVKSDINQIVKDVAEIPSFYNQKSRSGCTLCIFSRRSEVIDAWKTSPDILDRAAKMEGLNTTVLELYNALPTTVSKLTGYARNWLSYYRPSDLINSAYMGFEAKRGKNKVRDDVLDLFGASDSKKLYVAVEYEYENRSELMMAVGMSPEPMIYFERVITYSTSLGGLKTALKHFWLHRLMTKEMHGQDEEGISRQRQIQIIEMEVNDFENEIPPKPDDGAYTWQNDQKPLYAIRKTVAVIERILLTEGIRQLARSNDSYTRRQYADALSKIELEKDYGRILSSMRYEKPNFQDLTNDADIADAPVACMSCAR